MGILHLTNLFTCAVLVASKKCYGHYFWIWCNPFINCYRSARRFARSSAFRQCINLVKAKISNGYIIIEMKKKRKKEKEKINMNLGSTCTNLSASSVAKQQFLKKYDTDVVG